MTILLICPTAIIVLVTGNIIGFRMWAKRIRQSRSLARR